MWSSSLLSFLVVYSFGDGAITTDAVDIEVSVGEYTDGACDVALDLTDLSDAPGTYVIASDDPFADVQLLVPADIPGAESGICTPSGAGDVCTYGYSGEETVDWTVDLEVPFGQSTLSIVDASGASGEVIAEVGVGCTCPVWGDFNLDGTVNTYDLILLLGSFSMDVTAPDRQYMEPPEWLTAVTPDGVVGHFELTVFLGLFSTGCED